MEVEVPNLFNFETKNYTKLLFELKDIFPISIYKYKQV